MGCNLIKPIVAISSALFVQLTPSAAAGGFNTTSTDFTGESHPIVWSVLPNSWMIPYWEESRGSECFNSAQAGSSMI